ncbi:phosphatase, Ppx/GppA family protein [Oceaniovalibus guishaninsula JLT2003]|uniref:Phosphatase, Ppx/GppA family protein n=1 Tax=Oceaniovalibus guishaninsula JLT2003 TaxID=1231392 RepID=K2HRT5_9RHOB|nr:Ppx/GppA family phosphatase [Oceaniovalibus guishaninsula]EKE45439.1 phosphatase, Ppx/GppA family protein [Oceaniovalibus guishaninsula JLT2003]
MTQHIPDRHDPDAASDDFGPFGRPLFDDPDARALERVGVIDIGSNSVRLVVFDGAARSPAYFFNEKVMCGLGRGFAATGRLDPEGRTRALAALRRFAKLASGMGASPVIAVATAAVREASDGPEFRAEVTRETGLRMWVVNGREEARLSAQGVLLGWPGAEGLVSDIGGSSMELAKIGKGKVGARVSTRLGPLRLQGLGSKKAIRAEIEETIAAQVAEMGMHHKRLFLVGGSWRAIGRIDMERRGYPLHVLHEYRMDPADIRATIAHIHETGIDALRAQTGIGEARMALVPLASLVLGTLVRKLKPREIAVSSYGIREGMLYQQMPQHLRDRDPLIEACRFAERKDARMPGFGRALYKFVAPLFKKEPESRHRILRAACLLHDVSWRTHPDYRHEACFDNATRANLGGLTHPERVFLGLALLHRYKNSRAGTRFEGMIGILSEPEIAQAEVLGRAMRFGAMFSAQKPNDLGELRWFPKRRHLELRLSDSARDLMGEVAVARFKSLAAALQATHDIGRRVP